MSQSAQKLAEEKRVLRQQLKQKLQQLDKAKQKDLSQKLVENLQTHLQSLQPNFSADPNASPQKAPKILAFHPLPQLEPNIQSLLFDEQGDSKGILLPRIEGQVFHPAQVTHQTELIRSRFNTYDPPKSAPTLDPKKLQAVLVPALAFNQSGQRLGRGGGFYDRFLSQLPPTCQRIGLCFECQLLPQLPEEAHDQRVQLIITEAAIYSIQ